MKKEELIGEQRIRKLFGDMIFPGAKLGEKSDGTKMYRVIQGEPGLLTREQERAARMVDNEIRVVRWGAKNQNYYILVSERAEKAEETAVIAPQESGCVQSFLLDDLGIRVV